MHPSPFRIQDHNSVLFGSHRLPPSVMLSVCECECVCVDCSAMPKLQFLALLIALAGLL